METVTLRGTCQMLKQLPKNLWRSTAGLVQIVTLPTQRTKCPATTASVLSIVSQATISTSCLIHAVSTVKRRRTRTALTTSVTYCVIQAPVHLATSMCQLNAIAESRINVCPVTYRNATNSAVLSHVSRLCPVASTNAPSPVTRVPVNPAQS